MLTAPLGSAQSALLIGYQNRSEVVMKTIFSTTEVHPRDRFDYWHDVAIKTLVDHDSKPECHRTFRAELQSGVLADIGLVLFENSPMAIWHRTHHVARANTDVLFVCRQIAGGIARRRYGCEVGTGTREPCAHPDVGAPPG